MGTYQGARYLPLQLDSIARQTGVDWSLWVSDDGSTDATRQVVADFARDQPGGRVHLLDGPRRGFAANFLSLLCNPAIQADAWALADQDDVWHTGKLARAGGWLAGLGPDRPGLYTARTRLVDARGQAIGLSPPAPRTPGFAHALVQNIASGNTMMINAAARALLCAAPGPAVPLHDWWCYQLISGAGGAVCFDPQPCLDYRQHDANQIGQGRGWQYQLQRIQRLWAGGHQRQLDAHLQALAARRASLTPDHACQLDAVLAARRRHGLGRAAGYWRARVRRRTRLSQLALYLAALLDRA
ncbi:glycosyltransferase family 2 protein [Castellaniella defragrans]|uniref:glycosyltransferase family 2 protein n=1 Tax=Castellaniella defragrans TaxID=75697 RepID=UPI002AFFEF28|nr:glycosyltransferase family 2 protein [Castellaniella defragrans]